MDLKYIPIEQLELSKYNPRITRPKIDVERLAERIDRNGFEITRALWVYEEDDKYKVFAGGTRFNAAKMAKLSEIPCLIHNDLSPDEIVKLAYRDNENDEYHAPVCIVDRWLDVKKLYDEFDDQQRVGDAVGISQQLVSSYLKYAKFPQSILDIFTTNDFLGNTHARELTSLLRRSIYDLDIFNVTYEWVMTQVLESVLVDNAKSVTAEKIKNKVDEKNKFYGYVQECHDGLELYQEEFLKSIGKLVTSDMDKVRKRYEKYLKMIAELKRQAKKLADDEYEEISEEVLKQQMIDEFMESFVCGDVQEMELPDEINFWLTDPPYGIDFQSNRRAEKKDKIKGDVSLKNALDLLKNVGKRIYPKMANDSTTMVFSSPKNEPYFRQCLISIGFQYRDTYVWNKNNHGSGGLATRHAPKHDCIIHLVKGNPKINESQKRPDSVMNGNEFLKTEHPTKKPIDLISLLIKTWTDEDDLVVDTFAGSGVVPIAAVNENRHAWACELEDEWATEMKNKLLDIKKEKVEKEFGTD